MVRFLPRCGITRVKAGAAAVLAAGALVGTATAASAKQSRCAATVTASGGADQWTYRETPTVGAGWGLEQAIDGRGAPIRWKFHQCLDVVEFRGYGHEGFFSLNEHFSKYSSDPQHDLWQKEVVSNHYKYFAVVFKVDGKEVSTPDRYVYILTDDMRWGD